ncbi:MAG: DUF3307 domain-containing protein [Bacteroidia bacterium]|nr:DUF3307 domain-containing protein [Bacteroidia bacterium]
MMYNDVEILLRLLIAHALSDFIFQSTKWVKHKNDHKIHSGYLYLHIAITFVLTYLALGSWQPIWIPLVIGVSHFAIDLLKLYIKESPWRFITDQLLHIFVIVLCWGLYTSQLTSLSNEFVFYWDSPKVLIYIASYLLVSIPASILVVELTKKWDLEVNSNSTDSLKNAGKWIGIIERILILTFTLLGSFEPIGFMMAAKSVFRFGDLTNSNDKKRTEYVLVGTLLSFAVSIIVGLLTKQIIKIL